MDLMEEFVARMNHSCRSGYFHSMRLICLEALEKFPNDPIFRFYHGMSLLFENKNSEGLRILEPLQNEPPVSLGACIASEYGHKACVNIDREELASIEVRIRDKIKGATQDTLFYAGVFLFFIGEFERSKEFLDKLLKFSDENVEALALRGRVQMKLRSKKGKDKESLEYFERAVKANRKHMETLMGLASYYEQTHQFEKGLEKLNELLAFYPNWWPAIIEKMNLSLCTQDWDQALENANRVLSLERENLEAQRFKILFALCRDGDMEVVGRALELFFTLCRQHEPDNPKFFVENSRLFSQLASYDNGVLTQSLKFARQATELSPECAEYVADIGRIYLLLGKHKEAYNEFRVATSLDGSSMSPLYGNGISCQLAEGEVDLAAQQLDFLHELAKSIDTPPELSYLTAVMAKKRNQSSQIVNLLNEALDAHFNKMRGLPLNVEYLKAINPDLVLKIVREYLQFAPQEPVDQGSLPPMVVRQSVMILESVTKVCPTHRDALFISAQTKYLSGDMRSASLILNQIFTIDPSIVDCHLLMAQVHLAQELYSQASRTLEYALSCSFKVREHPKYLLLLARVQKHGEEYEKALTTLQSAFQLLKSRKFVNLEEESLKSPVEFGLSDKLSLYLEMSTILILQGKQQEASSVMEEAMLEFKGTHLEGRISLSQAEELIENGELEKALNLLRVVEPDQGHFTEAKKMMANIFLNHKQDNNLYVSCYKDIVDHNPTPMNLVLLGEAYMAVQEPEKGIEAFESALAKNPKDPALAAKMGQALIKTHYFAKAINYYTEAIKSDDHFDLRYDLSALQIRLKQWDKAERTVQQALTDHKDSSLNGIMTEMKLLVLLSKTQEGAGNVVSSHQSLLKAKEVQHKVLKRSLLEQPSLIDEQKIQFVKICKLLGDIQTDKQAEIDLAIRSLKEALEIRPDDLDSISSISKLYMKVGDHVHCQQMCQQMLKIKPDSAEASAMLGELFFRKYDFTTSCFHFQQFLETNPTHWMSLSWYIDCARRSGLLHQVGPYIKAVASQCEPNDPGFGYCQGLYEWYNGNTNSALKNLNMARKDPVFGQKALYLMIDIYLNPSGGILGGDALESSVPDKNSTDQSELREVSLKAAEMLVWDLVIKTGEDKFKRQVLECFVLLTTRNKNKMEKAVQELTGLITTDIGRDSVMLIYVLATGYMLIKQTPRARNQLKRLLKATWTVEDAEYLERCWLLLSDIYIQSSKFDLATDLIKKVVHFNKSCTKANEYLGYIMEKEQAYADAAINYEIAWRMTNCSNPTLGYKLAFNYLKAKRHTDAIDICHLVLSKHPNYPRIKKDIMEKARASLRA